MAIGDKYVKIDIMDFITPTEFLEKLKNNNGNLSKLDPYCLSDNVELVKGNWTAPIHLGFGNFDELSIVASTHASLFYCGNSVMNIFRVKDNSDISQLSFGSAVIEHVRLGDSNINEINMDDGTFRNVSTIGISSSNIGLSSCYVRGIMDLAGTRADSNGNQQGIQSITMTNKAKISKLTLNSVGVERLDII